MRVVGTGAVLPAEELTSQTLDERLGLAPGTVFVRTGVRRRFVERRPAAVAGRPSARLKSQS